MTRAGQLRDRVAFDAPLTSDDGRGGKDFEWDVPGNATTRWANIRYLRGSEVVQAARLQGRQPVVITVRRDPATEAITTDWRVRDLRTSSVFNIRSGPVLSDDRAFLEFTAESGVAI